MMLWKAEQGMIGRKAHVRMSSACEKGALCYVGSTGEKQQVTLLGSEKRGVHHGGWWLSQKTGLRGACGCLVCCPVLNSHHVTADFVPFAVRDIF